MDASWKSDLERWLAPFISALRHKRRARMCPVYVAGLIGAGDRKSVQPMAARDGDVGYDQLHHFIASGVWDASAAGEGAARRSRQDGRRRRCVADRRRYGPAEKRARIRSASRRNMHRRWEKPPTVSRWSRSPWRRARFL